MTYFKYFIILCMSMSAYGCNSTKAIITSDNSLDKPATEVEVQTKNRTDVKVEVEESEMEEPTIVNGKIKDAAQTDYVTIIPVIDHSPWNELLQKHVSNLGNVNYKGFKADHIKFNAYLKMLSNNSPKESWGKNETLAFWMNVYNAYTVKLILNNYPTQSIKDIHGPWNERFIKIGEKWYTLNDVEQRIIRKMDEPRIHFALVCAAVSCPRLYNKAFTAKDLETDLELLTKGFLSDTTKNEFTKDTLKISKIFKWYGSDFKNDGKDLIDFFNQYADIEISSKAKKSYKDYNWSLNE